MAEEERCIGLENEKHQTERNQGPEDRISNDVRHMEQPVFPNVKLCIRSQDGDECYFRVRRDKRIGKLLFNYCHKKKIDYHAVAFICDGRRVKPTQTPDELGMDNEDVIDVMLRQIGGGY